MPDRLTFRLAAGDNTVFTEAARQHFIGQHVPLNVRDTDDGPVTEQLGMCTVVTAELLDGGTVALLTVERD